MTGTVLITGAGRGIGQQLADQYLTQGWTVLACARKSADLDALANRGAETFRLEVTSDQDVAALKSALDGRPIDVLINNAGIIGPDRQALSDMDYDGWAETIAVNVFAPFRVSTALAGNVAAAKGKIAVVSSKMGSMGLNVSSDRIAYRSSKAAVNQVVVNMANEWRSRDITVIAMHPGWVSTDMGGAQAPVTPAESAAGLIRTIAAATPDKSGHFFNFDGDELDW